MEFKKFERRFNFIKENYGYMIRDRRSNWESNPRPERKRTGEAIGLSDFFSMFLNCNDRSGDVVKRIKTDLHSTAVFTKNQPDY
jgi:hypothetical protein